MERPAERALLDGIRAYDDAQYAQAEKALRLALAGGLQSTRDRATAHKLLAFITCTSDGSSSKVVATLTTIDITIRMPDQMWMLKPFDSISTE